MSGLLNAAIGHPDEHIHVDSDAETLVETDTDDTLADTDSEANDSDGSNDTIDVVDSLESWIATPRIFFATFNAGGTTNMVVKTVFGTEGNPATTPKKAQEFTKSLITSVTQAYVSNPAGWLDGPVRMKREFSEAAPEALREVFGDAHRWRPCEVSRALAIPRDQSMGVLLSQPDDTTEEECMLAIQHGMNIRESQMPGAA